MHGVAIYLQLLKGINSKNFSITSYIDTAWKVFGFFWSLFSRIRTEYSYTVRMLENVDQKNLEYRHF